MLSGKMLRAIAVNMFFVLALLQSNSLLAQDTIRRQAFYRTKILQNNPEQAANLHIGLSPAYIDANNLNIAFGFGAEASYLLQNKFSVGIRYQHAYLDRIEEDDLANAPGVASVGTTPSRNVEIGAVYYFKKDTSVRYESVFMSRSKLAGENIDFTIDVPARHLRLWGLRGGFLAYKSFIRDNEGSIEFKGYMKDDPAKKVVDFYGAYSTMMETNTIYAGISRLDVTRLLLLIEGNGKRVKQHRAELYADVLYAPAIVFYNMSARGTASSVGFQEYDINTYTPRSRYGARFGFTRWSLNAYGIGFGAETGVRPGATAGIANNAYINLRVSANLSKHI